MEKEYFKGQSGFLADYKKAVKDPDFDSQKVLEDVLAQLDLPENGEAATYVVAGSKTKSGRPMKFPFKKEMVAQDQEATISDEFFYEGAPFEFDLRDEEQL